MATKRVIYSDLEKQVFLEILKKYKHTIESKGTNSSTLKEKSEAWFIITQEYNESPLISNKRDVSQLKKYWSNLKQQNKNILTAERQARFLTGGGRQKNVGEVDSNVLDIIPSLMTTAPTMSSSNFTRNESTDRQKEICKAVKQNNLTVLNEVSNEQHLKKTPIKTTTLSCSQHESASDLSS
ncbi:myb/SANT-like DNA-binding domain-containing protein 3 [Temnothorax nylanderi]|uniref:myb/SANT-like DNA-binding domain-containing protein 3 n=1 Tax=Temnothorax nylanderi TaxID=102681 RepID=UPI003A888C99